MILVIGGIASGRRSYIRSLGFADADMSTDAFDACPVLLEAQDLVRPDDADALSVAKEIAERKRIVMCQEVGSGVVPIDRGERVWRDRAGALAKELASRAEAVVRLTCGIPQVLKGEHPRDSVEVVIMRHGSTEANERHEYAGWTDVPLSGVGEAEAAAAGICPQVSVAYLSPLARARRTAEICFPRAQQVVIDGFREMNFGDFEGKSASEMEHDAAYRAWVDGSCVGRCPNGECRSELRVRVADSLEAIVREALQRGDERVVVVGHGGTIMAAMDAFAVDERGYFDWQVGNCEGYRSRARFDEGRLVLENPVRFGDLSFLGDVCDDAAGHPQPSASFFTNRACEYFPCHEGVDERDFNCLFCYCPLYALGPRCGGKFTYTKNGTKNCKDCPLPHMRESGAKLVRDRFAALSALAADLA